MITTKSLVIYGTGRGGGPPGTDPALLAVDKATGKQVASVPIPSHTTAVPMTGLMCLFGLSGVATYLLFRPRAAG